MTTTIKKIGLGIAMVLLGSSIGSAQIDDLKHPATNKVMHSCVPEPVSLTYTEEKIAVTKCDLTNKHLCSIDFVMQLPASDESVKIYLQKKNGFENLMIENRTAGKLIYASYSNGKLIEATYDMNLDEMIDFRKRPEITDNMLKKLIDVRNSKGVDPEIAAKAMSAYQHLSYVKGLKDRSDNIKNGFDDMLKGKLKKDDLCKMAYELFCRERLPGF